MGPMTSMQGTPKRVDFSRDRLANIRCHQEWQIIGLSSGRVGNDAGGSLDRSDSGFIDHVDIAVGKLGKAAWRRWSAVRPVLPDTMTIRGDRFEDESGMMVPRLS